MRSLLIALALLPELILVAHQHLLLAQRVAAEVDLNKN